MIWKETDSNIWRLQIKSLRIAVFRPLYDRNNWYYSIDQKDSKRSFSTHTAAQAASLEAAAQLLSQEIADLQEIQHQVQQLLSRLR